MSASAEIGIQPPIGLQSQRRKILTDSLWMTAAGQLERAVGILLTLAMRWGLTASDLGLYSGLRLLLDNTSMSSLGVALGAIQKRLVLMAQGDLDEADRITHVASTTNTITSAVYGLSIILLGVWFALQDQNPMWSVGMVVVGLLAIVKRHQDFQIAVLRSDGHFSTLGWIALLQNFGFALFTVLTILSFGFWGLLAGLIFGMFLQNRLIRLYFPDLLYSRKWDFSTSVSLAWSGIPILAANSAWNLLGTLDRAMILAWMSDGTTQAGYYSLAVLATNWSSDIGGRFALVLYPHYRFDVGKGKSPERLLIDAERASLGLISVLSVLGLIAFHLGMWLLPLIFPRLTPGMAAFGPMLPGAIALAATWPLRQAWVAMNRPWILAFMGLIVAMPFYFLLKAQCLNGSIADVAQTTSLIQAISLITLLVMGWHGTLWTKARWFYWIKTTAFLFTLLSVHHFAMDLLWSYPVFDSLP